MQTTTTTQLDQLLDLTCQQAQRIEYLEERIQILMAQLYGQKSEKQPLPPADQLSFIEAALFEELTAKGTPIEVPAYQRMPKGRQPLPEELPRIEVLHDLPEDEKHCACGA